MSSITQSPKARHEGGTTITKGTRVRLLMDHWDGTQLRRAGEEMVWNHETPPLADVAIAADEPRGAEGTRERP